ncbi:MAG TPA: aldolase, partial [Nordella sp.]|nr:aldolase [Nordella sp.]
MAEPITIHASCVALGDADILIEGAPGSGKSDLTLRLIDEPGFGCGNLALRGRLVSDDQTIIERRGQALFAASPKPIAGLLEIRGQGVMKVDHLAEVKLVLAVKLLPVAQIERMPEAAFRHIAGIALREISIDPGQASAPARIRAALT